MSRFLCHCQPNNTALGKICSNENLVQWSNFHDYSFCCVLTQFSENYLKLFYKNKIFVFLLENNQVHISSSFPGVCLVVIVSESPKSIIGKKKRKFLTVFWVLKSMIREFVPVDSIAQVSLIKIQIQSRIKRPKPIRFFVKKALMACFAVIIIKIVQ